MSEQETKILKTFAVIIPGLSESDKSYLLGLGEGMAIKMGGQQTASPETVKDTKELLPEYNAEYLSGPDGSAGMPESHDSERVAAVVQTGE